jgi:hypothetical protein
MIKLKIVSKLDINFLFELLKNRTLFENISHKIMPIFKNHEKFVNSKPYFKWYVIYEDLKKIGSAYITNQNEIGIHFISIRYQDDFFLKSLKIIMEKHPRKRFLININPKNKQLKQIIEKNNFKLIQHTYELGKNN